MSFDAQLEHAPPWNDVSALFNAGYYGDALTSLRRLVAKAPHDLVARQALAQTALIYGDYVLAMTNYRPLARDRGAEDDHVGYLSALYLSGKRKQFGTAMPPNPAAWSRIVQTLSDLGELVAARQVAKDACVRFPEAPGARVDSGVIESALGQGAVALQLFEQAVALDPEDLAAQYNIARTSLSLGDRARAVDVAVALLEKNPSHINAYRLLGSLRERAVWNDDRVAILTGLLEDNRLDGRSRSHLLYALGAAHDLRDELDLAVETYRAAGAAIGRAVPYEISVDLLGMKRLRDACRTPLFDEKTATTDQSALIVVCGLPRSGTTLVEQIIAAHSKAATAGETGMLRDAVLGTLSGQYGARTPFASEFARGLVGPAPAATRRFARDVRNDYRKLGLRAPCIVEKAPRNLHYAHAIAALHPRARFIDVRRDLRDVCVSCMTMDFAGTYGFCDDLDAFTEMATATREHMDDLAQAFPSRTFTVDYEELVADPETQIPRLIAFVGLEMEPACLQPETSGNAIKTASAAQVREPINAKSVGRWRRYETALSETFAKLVAGA